MALASPGSPKFRGSPTNSMLATLAGLAAQALTDAANANNCIQLTILLGLGIRSYLLPDWRQNTRRSLITRPPLVSSHACRALGGDAAWSKPRQSRASQRLSSPRFQLDGAF